MTQVRMEGESRLWPDGIRAPHQRGDCLVMAKKSLLHTDGGVAPLGELG